MRCLICNKEISEDIVFCPFCGAKNSNTVSPVSESDRLNILQDEEDNVFETIKMEIGSDEQLPREVPAPIIDFSGDDLDDYPVIKGVASSDEIPLSDEEQKSFAFLTDTMQNKKKSLFKKLLIPVTALILAVAVISSAYISSVLLTGPFVKVMKAGSKLIKSESFSFTLNVETKNQKTELKGVILFRPSEKIFELLAESKATKQSGIDYNYTFVIKDRHLKFVENNKTVMNEDIGVWFDDFFKTYEETFDKKDIKEIDWAKIFKTLGLKIKINDSVSFGQKASNFIKNINKEKYINESLGRFYSFENESTTTLVYDINSENLADALINEFAAPLGITDTESKLKILKEDLKKEFGDNIRIKFGITDGLLSGIVIDCNNFLVTLNISDTGSADTQKIKTAYETEVSTVQDDESGQRI